MKHEARLVAPMPLDLWPFGDRLLWTRAQSHDPLQPGGRGGASGWRPATKALVAYSYAVWLAWLQKTGQLDHAAKPEARIDIEVLREFLSSMRWAGYAESSCATRLRGLAAMLRVLAPQFDSSLVARAADRVGSEATRVRPIQARSQDPIDVLDLALDLMKRAEGTDRVPWQAAADYRDGLLLCLLVHRPLRIRNLASIELERHLQCVGRSHRLWFPASEMKGGRDYTCDTGPIDRQLVRYLTVFRPILVGRGSAGSPTNRLWVGSCGQPLVQASVTSIIRRRTLERFGVSMGPHLMRHIIATTVAEQAPERVGDVAAILGHQSYRASEQNYVHARTAVAVRHLDDAIARVAAKGRG